MKSFTRTFRMAALLVLLLSFGFGSNVFAQYYVLNEGFEGDFPPSGWTLQTDAGSGWEQTSLRAHTGVNSAYYNDYSGTQDAWLISPAIDLSEAPSAILKFWENDNWSSYAGEHEIAVSTDLVAWTVLSTTIAPEDTWVETILDLTPFVGQSVYVGFHYTGNFSDEWYLDDIRVETPPPPTGTIEGWVTNDYGVPMIDVNISISGAITMNTTTIGNGNFIFEDVPRGMYTLTADAGDPYNVIVIENVEVVEDVTTYQNITMTRPVVSANPEEMFHTMNPNEMEKQILELVNAGGGPAEFFAAVEYEEEMSDIISSNFPTNGKKPAYTMVRGASNKENAHIVGKTNSTRALECPAEAIFSQPPADMTTAATSEAGPGYNVFSSFNGVALPIGGVTFWGVQLYNNGGWSGCDENPVTYNIGFWANDNGAPGAEVATFVGESNRTETGELLFGQYPIYEYHVELDASVSLVNGFVSVQGAGAEDCWFLWVNNPNVTGGFQYDGAAMSDLGYGLSFCLTPGGAGNWLSLDDYNGTIPASTEEVFDLGVNFDATGLGAGEYHATINFTFDPEINPISVPVTLTVAGDALTPPTDFVAKLVDDLTGEVELTWEHPGNKGFTGFEIKRNGVVIKTLTENSYTDMLPEFGLYEYELVAVYEEGHTKILEASILWAFPAIVADPTDLSAELWPNDTTMMHVTIDNEGEGLLEWKIAEFVGMKNATNLPKTLATAGSDVAETHKGNASNAQNKVAGQLQFSYDVDTPSGMTGIAGAECDGQFFYVTKWASSDIAKFDLNGNYIETFSIAGVSGLRDLAYDGQYFYGGAASTTIYKMDFASKQLIGTISSPTAVRAIAYDSDQDGFWVNNWSTDMTLVGRDGTQKDVISGPPSMYGAAYDNVSDGGPYIWFFSGTSSGGGCQIEQYSIATHAPTGLTYSVSDVLGSGAIAGGLFIQSGIVDGMVTIGGLAQSTPDLLWGMELTEAGPVGGGSFIVDVDPATGTLTAGGSVDVKITYSSIGFEDGEYTETLHLESNDPDNASIEILNTLNIYTPGTISGMITDANTGNPIMGAVIEAVAAAPTKGIPSFYKGVSLEDGTYTLNAPEGTYDVTAKHTEYQDMTALGVAVVNTEDVVVDFAMDENANPPFGVTAEANDDDDMVTVEWTLGGEYEIVYDDGTPENSTVWANSGSVNALKFTPAGYPAKVSGGSVYIPDASQMGDFLQPFVFVIYAEEDGMPGAELDRVTVDPAQQWSIDHNWVSFVSHVVIEEGNFFIGMEQGGNAPNAAPIGIDESSPKYRSYSKFNGGAWTVAGFQDFMIRATVVSEGGTPGLVKNSEEIVTPKPLKGQLAYRQPNQVRGFEGAGKYMPISADGRAASSFNIYRLMDGEQGDPTLWTLLGTSTTTQFQDPSWETATQGSYVWAVEAIYPNGDISEATFSNFLGKLMWREVLVNVNTTDGESPEGALVKMTQNEYPFFEYQGLVGPDWTYKFDSIWVGNYTLTVGLSGYDEHSSIHAITDDTEIDVMLVESTYPPRYLFVDTMGYATWFPPAAFQTFFSVMPAEGWTNYELATTGYSWSLSSSAVSSPSSAYHAYTGGGTAVDNWMVSPQLRIEEGALLNFFEKNDYMDYYGLHGIYVSAGSADPNDGDFELIEEFNKPAADFTMRMIDLADYVGQDVYFGIRYEGEDASDWWVDNFEVSNVKVINSDRALGGYNVYLDDVLVATVPAEQTFLDYKEVVSLNPGQYYNAAVTAIYSSGQSEPATYMFQYRAFYAPTDLNAVICENPNDSNVCLTWKHSGGAGSIGSILVVDHDMSSSIDFTDDWTHFQAALDANELEYDYHEVMEGENGPDLATMQEYDNIIWFTGESWHNGQTLTSTDEGNLGAYLDGGGRLFLSSHDYFYDQYSSAGSFSAGQFPYDYLGVRSTVQDQWWVSNGTMSLEGVDGSAAEGYTFMLDDIYSTKEGNPVDELIHDGVDMFRVTDPAPVGICAIQYENTVYTAASFASITDPTIKAELLNNILSYLSGTKAGTRGGVMGFNVYRDGVVVNDVLVPAEEKFYKDVDVDAGCYSYNVTAVYDLTPTTGEFETGYSNTADICVLQKEITGTVTEKATGDPIEGATVTIGDLSTTTAANGTYSLNQVFGYHPAMVEAAGFITYIDENLYVSGDIDWDVEMTRPVIRVEPGLIVETMAVGGSTIVASQELEIFNDGDGQLHWFATMEDVSKAAQNNITELPIEKANGMSFVAENHKGTPSVAQGKEIGDLQFSFDVDTPSGLTGLAGAECDGEFFYVTKWSGSEIAKFNLDGTFVEVFSIPGVSGLRDLAYDGEYFYGGNAGNTIYKMDFVNKTLEESISSPAQVRSIAYDNGSDGFWVNNWDSDMTLVDRSGSVLDVISAPPSQYGSAYDPFSAGGPYIWFFTGTSSGGGCQVEQFSIADHAATGLSYSVSGIIGDAIAGGLFIQPGIVEGTVTIGGLGQASPDLLWGIELGPDGFVPGGLPWLYLNEFEGVIEPGESYAGVLATFDQRSLPAVAADYKANIFFHTQVETFTTVEAELHMIVGMTDLESEAIQVYPVPASENVMFKVTDQVSEIRVMNYEGQMIYAENVKSAQILEFSVSDMAAGAYMVQFVLNDGTVTHRRMVVTK